MDNGSHGSTIPVIKGRKGKGTSTRRTWKESKEAILMDLFKGLVVSGGWKSENDFRSRCLQQLEAKLREKIPGTDIRASPHINSRITIWKRHHSAIQVALEDSGGGFNSETKILDVSDIAWEKAVKKESTIASMRYKSWSFYYDCLEVFGNDEATGNSSQTVMDVVNDLVNEDAREDATKAEAFASHQGVEKNTLDEDDPCEMDVESQAPNVDPSKPSAPTPSNKRVSQSPLGTNRELLDGLDVLFKKSDEHLANVVETIIHHPVQVQPVEAIPTWSKPPTCNISDVFSILESIPDLTFDERLDASENIVKRNQRWEFFSGLLDHARPRYVRRLLDGDFD